MLGVSSSVYISQEHRKHTASAQEAAAVLKTQVNAQRTEPRSGPSGKKEKDKNRDDGLAGKRVLYLAIARALAPPGA